MLRSKEVPFSRETPLQSPLKTLHLHARNPINAHIHKSKEIVQKSRTAIESEPALHAHLTTDRMSGKGTGIE